MGNSFILLILFGTVACTSYITAQINSTARIYVAGHTGLAGAALIKILHQQGYTNIIVQSHTSLHLEDSAAVMHFFEVEKPEYVFIAAAVVPKPNSTDNTVDVVEINFRIISNLLRAALTHSTKKVLVIGSIYAYPAQCIQPVTEDQLLSGSLDPAMYTYGLTKNLCLALCLAYNSQYHVPFISCIPAIIYGPQDLLDQHSSKPIIQIITTLVHAHCNNLPYVIIKDNPQHLRDYLFVDDFAQACLYLMQKYTGAQPINIGSGSGISTHDLTEHVAKQIGYSGTIIYDETAYNMPAHVYNTDAITTLGWNLSHTLIENINILIKTCLQKNDILLTHP